MLSQIVTGDETWVSHITPESIQLSMEWLLKSKQMLSVKIKAKKTLLKRNVMAIVLWDQRGVLLIDFLPRETKINADAYCETVRQPHLGRKRLSDDEQVKAAIDSWLAELVANSLEEEFLNLVFGYDKCLNKEVNYVKI